LYLDSQISAFLVLKQSYHAKNFLQDEQNTRFCALVKLQEQQNSRFSVFENLQEQQNCCLNGIVKLQEHRDKSCCFCNLTKMLEIKLKNICNFAIQRHQPLANSSQPSTCRYLPESNKDPQKRVHLDLEI